MKKFIFLLAAVFIFAGCAADSPKEADNAAPEALAPEEKFTDGDFTMYGENGVPFVSLAANKEDVEKRLESFKNEVGSFDVKYKEHIITYPDKDAEKEELVNYIGYFGPRVPVFTSKGISTTGLYGDAELCSSDADVIKAYGIDAENESYITNKTDDKNYFINIYYNGEERLTFPKDADIQMAEAQKLIRFTINDGIVRNIEFYQYFWELL